MSISNRKGLQYTYFDDFFKKDSYAKKYRQILFHPGSVLQSRELLQLQTIMNEYDKNHLDAFFKNGTFMQGCNIDIVENEDIYRLHINKGLIYFDGTVHKIGDTYLELTQDVKNILLTNDNVENVKIGIIANYEIINNTGDLSGTDSDEQQSLLDPAIKYFENDSVIGADRLKIEFNILLSIGDNYVYINNDGQNVCENSFDFDKIHYFDHSGFDLIYGNNIWTPNTTYSVNDLIVPTSSNGNSYICTQGGTSATTEPTGWGSDETDIDDGTVKWKYLGDELGAYSINNINYTNREFKFRDIATSTANINDSIIEGLDIQCSNSLDFEFNINNTYVNMNKGIGEINDISIPVAHNTIYKFNKPSKNEDGTNSGNHKETLFCKNKKEGIFFKQYIDSDILNNLGYFDKKFDHNLNKNFLDVGSEIAIQINKFNEYVNLATATVSHIDETLYQNDSVDDPSIYDTYKYKGFWGKNTNSIYIEGVSDKMGIIKHLNGNDYKIYTGAVEANRFFSGKDAICLKYEITVKCYDFNNIYDGNQSYTELRLYINNLDGNLYSHLHTDDSEDDQMTSMIILNGKLYYILNINNALDDDDNIINNIYILRICNISSDSPSTTNNVNQKYTSSIDSIITNNFTYDTNYDITIIPYQQIDSTDGQNIQLFYEGIPTKNWSILLNTSRDFFIITSPWVDMVANKTIIRNIDNNELNIRNNFIVSKVIYPYFNYKFIPFTNISNFKIYTEGFDLVGTELTTENFNMYTYGDNTTNQLEYYPIVNQDMLAGRKIIFLNHTGTGNYVYIKVEPIKKEKKIKFNMGTSPSGTVTFQTPETGLKKDDNILIYDIKGSDPSVGKVTCVSNNSRIFTITFHDNIPTSSSNNITTFIDKKFEYCNRITNAKIHQALIPNESSEVIDNKIFWKYFAINSSAIIGVTSLIDTDYGTSTNLENFKVTYHSSKYKKVYIDDIKINELNEQSEITLDELTELLDNVHQRIVLGAHDPDGNFIYNYDNVLEKGINLNNSRDIQIINNEYLRYFNDLSIPYVDKINEYRINTIYNVPTTCTQVDTEGGVEWEKFTFGEDEKILGIYQAYGEKSLGVNGVRDLPVVIKTSFVIEGEEEDDDYEYIMYTLPDVSIVKYKIDHQGHINNDGFGDLGINITHYPDSKYVQKITFCSGSNGIGHYVGEDQVFTLNGIDKPIMHATGMKYFFKVDFGKDITTSFYYKVSSTGTLFNYYKSGEYEITNLNNGFASNDIGSLIIFNTEPYKTTYLITEFINDSTVKVLERVDDIFSESNNKYTSVKTSKVVGNNHFFSNTVTFPKSISWLPYINNYSFNLPDFQFKGVTIIDSQQSKSTIIVPDGAEIHLTQSSPITLSLLKNISSNDNTVESNIDILNIDHDGAYHPFRRITEKLNKKFGTIHGYKHIPIIYPDSDNYKAVNYPPEIYVDYDYILPDIAHMYLQQDGNFTYMKTIPEQYGHIKPFLQHNKLYIGTVTIPPMCPIYRDGKSGLGILTVDQKPFMSTGNQIFNHNKKVLNYFDKKEINIKIEENRSKNTLLEIYSLERRDLHSSSGKKHVYWEPVYVYEIKDEKYYVGSNITKFNTGDIVGHFTSQNAGKMPPFSTYIYYIAIDSKYIMLHENMGISNNYIYLRREQSINNIQYLMNGTSYSIFNNMNTNIKYTYENRYIYTIYDNNGNMLTGLDYIGINIGTKVKMEK